MCLLHEWSARIKNRYLHDTLRVQTHGTNNHAVSDILMRDPLNEAVAVYQRKQKSGTMK